MTVLARHLSPQEIADLHRASDIVLLPYQAITGSGALLSALTFGRPFVASHLPFFEETLALEPEAGRLFSQGDAVALADAVTDLLSVPESVRTAAAERLARQHAWDVCIAPVKPFFQRSDPAHSQAASSTTPASHRTIHNGTR